MLRMERQEWIKRGSPNLLGLEIYDSTPGPNFAVPAADTVEIEKRIAALPITAPMPVNKPIEAPGMSASVAPIPQIGDTVVMKPSEQIITPPVNIQSPIPVSPLTEEELKLTRRLLAREIGPTFSGVSSNSGALVNKP